MVQRGGGSLDIHYTGLDSALRILGSSRDGLQMLDPSTRRMANSQLRFGSKQIGLQLMPYVEGLVAGGAAPQAQAMSKTLTTKSDRMVVIMVGGKNPKGMSKAAAARLRRTGGDPPAGVLRGWRSGKAGNKRWKGSLAWGVERGAFPGTPDRYKVGRSGTGHVLGSNLDAIGARAIPPYTELVRDVLKAAGLI